MNEQLEEFALWRTDAPGDLLNQADNILGCLTWMVCENRRPGEELILPEQVSEGLAYTLQHVQDLVRCAAAKT